MTHAQRLRQIADRVHTGAIGTLADSEAIRAIAAELEALDARVPMTEAEALQCFIKAGCLGAMQTTYDSGPYEVTSLTAKAKKLVEALEAHHHITGKE